MAISEPRTEPGCTRACVDCGLSNSLAISELCIGASGRESRARGNPEGMPRSIAYEIDQSGGVSCRFSGKVVQSIVPISSASFVSAWVIYVFSGERKRTRGSETPLYVSHQ